MIHLVLSAIFFYFLLNYPSQLSAEEALSYNVLLVSFLLIGASLSSLKLRKKIDMFEPISIVFFVSFFLYVISPMIFLMRQDTSIDGYYMFKGATNATILYTISFFFFLFGYYKKKYRRQTSAKKYVFECQSKSSIKRILRFSYIGWGICFVLSLIYYIFGAGMSLSYILSLALASSEPSLYLDTPLKFLINFSWSMIPFWIYIMIYSKNKTLKILLTVYTAAIYMMGGNRFIFIILFGSLFVINYIIKNKRPSLKQISVVLSVLIVFLVVLGFARIGVRSGTGFSFSSFDPVEELYTSFRTNTNIVMPYYCIVDKMPSEFPHSWGYGYFIEPMVYFLPRVLFPWKPTVGSADIVLAMNNCTGFDITRTNGMATPSFSELYIEFGILGCFVGMILFGMLLRRLKDLYVNKNGDIHNLILYSVLFTTLFQVLIRGYMAMNVYMILFLIIPIYIVKPKRIKKYRL
jgi:oligosaccharide repeat unit polymerase